MSTLPQDQKPVTVPIVKSHKVKVSPASSQIQQTQLDRLTMLTAYDFGTALFLDEAGIDMLLVGDSLATVIYGEPNTLAVTMDDMIRHTRAVAKAARRALVVGDMPFLSYQVSIEQAINNAGRFLKEAGAQAIKLEGGSEYAPTVSAITRAGIPVMGHIGLTPQSIHAMGHYRMHGKSERERHYLLESALQLQQAGAFAIVLECIEPALAQEITEKVSIPTIGIGSGSCCDGEVLVIHDLVGLTPGRVPKFAVPEADLKSEIKRAALRFKERTQNARSSSL